MIEKDSAFLYIRHCVDVRDQTIRITNQSRSVYFALFLLLLYIYFTLNAGYNY